MKALLQLLPVRARAGLPGGWSGRGYNFICTAEKKEKALYFIIDDAGYSLEKLRPFLDFPENLRLLSFPGLITLKNRPFLLLKRGRK
jgi:hypothetical protein